MDAAHITFSTDTELREMAKGYAESMAKRGATTIADFRLACDYLCVLREELRLDLVSKISKYQGVEMVDAVQPQNYYPA